MGKKRMDDDEEVIEMVPDSSGTFKAVAVRKIKPETQMLEIPIPVPNFNMRRQSTIAQLLDGFIVGMDVVDRFLDKLDKIQRIRRKGGRRNG
jgi:hypothetical protein